MKGLFATAALGMVCIAVFAQGTLNFSNYGPGLEAKVYDWYNAPLTNTNTNLHNWVADLYWASGIVTNTYTLQPLNAPAPFNSDPSQAGFFFGGPRTIPVAPGSTITAQVTVWDLADGPSEPYVAAGNLPNSQYGESVLFQVTVTDPTNTPAIMTNLNGHPLRLWGGGVPLDLIVTVGDVGVRSNQFGFTVVPWWWMNSLVIEATTNLINPVWTPVQTNNYITGPFYFSDPQWTNYPTRIYRFPHHL